MFLDVSRRILPRFTENINSLFVTYKRTNVFIEQCVVRSKHVQNEFALFDTKLDADEGVRYTTIFVEDVSMVANHRSLL